MNSRREKIVQFYSQRYAEFKGDIKSVGWGSEESQRLRFKVLSEIADLSNCRICDFGCGFGDLSQYLDGRFKNVRYVGIDISEEFILEARQRYPRAVFEIRDILENLPEEKYDYVLSSGALSLKLGHHEAYVRKILEAMMNMSTRGVAVNFLSSYVDYQLEKNFHFAPEAAFALGKSLTRYVTLRHDYPLYEFTLYLYHQ